MQSINTDAIQKQPIVCGDSPGNCFSFHVLLNLTLGGYMSCIQETLKLKGDNPFLKIEGIGVVEGGGSYKGYDYLITFVRSHRCGYVAIPPGHPLDDEEDTYNIDVDVHGGITFNSREKFTKELLGIDCNDRWLGFDAMHYGDRKDFESAEKYGRKFSSLDREFEWEDGTVKKYDYMESECKKMIDQLIEMDS